MNPDPSPSPDSSPAAPSRPNDQIAGLELALAQAAAMIERLQAAPSLPLTLSDEQIIDPSDPDAWYCEEHPERLMGHDGCKCAGIMEGTRIYMLLNKLRLSDQRVREANMMRDELGAHLRRVLGAPVNESSRTAADVQEDQHG